jgi:SAM-dependent methyltransferase
LKFEYAPLAMKKARRAMIGGENFRPGLFRGTVTGEAFERRSLRRLGAFGRPKSIVKWARGARPRLPRPCDLAYERPMTDPRLFAPAVARNREAIVDVLRRVLPASGLALEIASGSGEHAAHFAAAFPDLVFQPSDPDPRARASIDAWSASSGLENLRPALALDAARAPWPLARADAILCINMIHISPFSATEGLLRQAGQMLPSGGVLYLYGPYLREGVAPAESNLAFDAWLRAQNPQWGLRDLGAVAALARENGFSAPEIVEMPANNVSAIFRRS